MVRENEGECEGVRGEDTDVDASWLGVGSPGRCLLGRCLLEPGWTVFDWATRKRRPSRFGESDTSTLYWMVTSFSLGSV